MITEEQYTEAKKIVIQYEFEKAERLKNCKHIKTHIEEEICSHTGRLEYEWVVCDECGKTLRCL